VYPCLVSGARGRDRTFRADDESYPMRDARSAWL